jgi:hypothetical protein
MMMAAKEIRFSQNWNSKLDCRYFTTIRMFTPDKYVIGEMYHIILKRGSGWVTDFGHAMAVEVVEILGSDLTESICGIDTGCDVNEAKDILKRIYNGIDVDKTVFSHVVLKYTLR